MFRRLSRTKNNAAGADEKQAPNQQPVATGHRQRVTIMPDFNVVWAQIQDMMGRVQDIGGDKTALLDAMLVTLTEARMLVQNNQATTKKVFLSYYQAQGQSEVQAIAAHAPRNTFFRDAEDLKHLHLLPNDVTLSRKFVLVMTPHLPAQSKSAERYGPLARPYCAVEIITAMDQDITIMPLQIVKPDMLPVVLPTTEEEVHGMMDVGSWQEVTRVTGHANPAKRLLDAVKAVQGAEKVEWHSTAHDSDENEKGLKQLFSVLGVDWQKEEQVDESMAKTSKSNNNKTVAVAVFHRAQAETEAVQFVLQTNKTFPDSGGLILPNSTDDAVAMERLLAQSHGIIVWMTSGIMTDVVALKTIMCAQKTSKHITLINLKKIGLRANDFKVPVTCEKLVSGSQDALTQMFKIAAKTFDATANADTTQAQTRAIWADLGLDASAKDDKLKNVPDVGDKYTVAIQKHRDFVVGTRAWVFDQLNTWVNKSSTSDQAGAFAIVGVGGMGKSVIAGEVAFRGSEVVRRASGDEVLQGVEHPLWNVVAVHFFKHDDAGKSDARLAVGSIARQLANTVDGFRQALGQVLDKVTDPVKEFSDLETLFLRCVVEPALIVVGDGTSATVKIRLVIVDALDECAGKVEFLKTITKLWPRMPKGYGLVLTSRPEDGVSKSDAFEPVILEQKEEHNKADIKAYLHARLPDAVFASAQDARQVIELISERAAGLFIFARLVVDRLLTDAKSRKITFGDADALPGGMEDLYVEYFSRFKKDVGGDRDTYARILAPIVAAREPMPLRMWREVAMIGGTGESEPALERRFEKEVLAPSSKLLDVSDGVVRVLHKSMVDFLVSEKAKANELEVNVVEGHALLAAGCERMYDEFVVNGAGRKLCAIAENEAQKFCIRHAAFHGVMGGTTATCTMAIKWVCNVERMFHWLHVGVGGDSARLFSLYNDGSNILSVDRGWRNGGKMELAQVVMDVVRLGRVALLVDARTLGGEVLGRVSTDVLKDGVTIAKEKTEVRKQALNMVQRLRTEEGVKVAVPAGELSGLEQAGGAIKMVLAGHTRRMSSVCFSHDGKQIVSGSNDETVRVWDADSGKEMRKLEGHTNFVHSVCFSPDGKRIVSGSDDKTVRIWDADSGKEIRKLEGHTNTVNSVCFSPDGKQIVSGSSDNTVRVWDADDGKVLHKLEGHMNEVTSVCFSPDGKRIVSGSGDKTVRVWDADNGKEIHKLEGHTSTVMSVCFSPGGKRIVSGSYDETVRIWDADNGKEMRKLEGHRERVWSVCFSADGKRVVSGSSDNTVRVWDADNGKEMRKLEGHTMWVASVCFSPDGKRIVSGSYDNTVRVWNAGSGKEIRKLEGHTNKVNSVCFSPDGKRIISGSGSSYSFVTAKDNTVRIWDADSGKELCKLEGHTSYVNSVCFSPNGAYIISRDYEKTVIYWNSQTFLREPNAPSSAITTTNTPTHIDEFGRALAVDGNVGFVIPVGSYMWVIAQAANGMSACGMRLNDICLWICG